MSEYNKKLGEFKPDNLIANTNIKVTTAAGPIVAGSGILQRGTVMSLSEGKLSVMKSGATPYGILTDDVDATKEVVAEVYLTGAFCKGGLHVADGYTLTDADIQTLRNGGIFVETAAN